MQKSDAILERLLDLHPKIIDLSLDRMHDILQRLGNPEKNLPPVIHVAGTNGKGSTIAYLRSILEAANLSVHVYTSPHLVRFNERIRLGGKLINEDYLSELLEHCEQVNDGDPITYFEITTAAAFKAFADNPADVLILEVGLGGRLDATNVVDEPLASVITPVSFDHEQFLGSEIRHIAMEKANIAKKDAPLIIGKQLPDAGEQILKTANDKRANIISNWGYEIKEDGFSYEDEKGILNLSNPNLNGPHQISNAALAIATLRSQETLIIPEECYNQGISNANWPARMQNISKSRFGEILPEGSELWLDGGHNPAAGDVIASSFGDKRLILICGMMENKDTAGYLKPLAPLTDQLYGIHVDGEASHPATEIVKFAWSHNIKAETADNVLDAIQKIDADAPVTVVICGSLYLAGQVLRDNDLIPE
ncbi:bifunctional folylpolyglutamate synthase/dihydrofolate synthase [Pseudemcibacter aquimaris]|uniref:bifunctional folylpolyglutamate synthase/dihydrofolate synthase n=1 Tax=Pseudemcibacter aquimaris TaxID=2857064 RepID=UPI002012456E|nr:folylpolyglutamate synthase/dihydrofolate synthase family protein [Pseudemcibacter aquimaris]MCC3862484.1 bifunctional folylpolyglutamate synthase/dihydrofolate synthase [Pseudemcibacter aquimaris]WDU59088.1 bifunctional folylpolyglutamate synthase/dihydrofolate synthase [Pseudemcibacter aquimaris]